MPVHWGLIGFSTVALGLSGTVFWQRTAPSNGLAETSSSGRLTGTFGGIATSLETWTDEALADASRAIQREQEVRRRAKSASSTARQQQQEEEEEAGSARLAPSFLYAHKKTYASADPIAAAYFLERHFGAKADRSPFQHHCKNKSVEQPITKNANFPATADQPRGFTIHFVKNPHKAPWTRMNASDLGKWVERWRGNFQATNTFDQYMDNHLGLVFDSLDPLVEGWQRDKVPFICRTWCCGPGMPQYPHHCPSGFFNTFFCEQGCYVEAPHGIIVEALCGLDSYNASRRCLTKIEPEELKVFDLCSSD
mmetsp:Transcript_34608/g.80825  ORF Transcript_34608/g.80825 Transcript_34608/m.80825 type:complete len:309 (-) Transcript_34608:253-1179(-)|eukprot:CAMPEP_0178390518 /NCGR_PEP_ID=MMETSP0689_2-20121128/10689_1 /TAXON_ID=160604 /ORGANISM="Amphidinium massartii, Strain CS-259" /LENGTH=308 /DNA_ID=CAMNT_0020011033 /DNA_START=86 /DNA_END=1012 /DNA_ORIENTATION=+